MRYARCFKSGVRTAFTIPDEWVQALPEQSRETHRNVTNVRDKHIAHSVNDWEIDEPVAEVCFEEGKQPRIVDVKVCHRRMLAIPDGWAESLNELASNLADRLERAYDDERQRVLALVRELDAEEIRRRLELPERHPGVRDVALARGRRS